MTFINAVNSSPTLRRLCGWESRIEIPSESTFSRAFSVFAETEIQQRIHASMVLKNIVNKLFGYKSTDSTSVKNREKSSRKNTKKKKVKKKGERLRKGKKKKKKKKYWNFREHEH